MKSVKVKRNWLVTSGLRLDASFHLSDGVRTRRIIDNFCPYPTTTISEEADDLFKGNIHKRVYVDSPNHGHQFYSASDLFKLDPESGRYISKKYSPYLKELELKKDWILITRSGTLGKVINTRADHEGKIGTDDLVRIKPSEKKIKRGYFYSFLASRHGYGLLTQSGYGGVVKHIEPHHISNLPIPILPNEDQDYIHKCIDDACELRVSANNLISSAIKLLESRLPNLTFKKIYVSSINSRLNHNSRLEATYNTQSIECFYSAIEAVGIATKSIQQLSKEVFTPSIFKRVRADQAEFGVPFLSGSDLLSQYPTYQNYLSKKMKNIDSYILRDGWLAIQDSGTIGYVSYITKFLDGVSATNNLVRVVPNEEENYNYYIYCFLKTSIGQSLLKAHEYGSVQKHIDNNQVSNFRIPLIEDCIDEISDNIRIAMSNLSTACSLELKAITRVENEIESWQKS